MKHRARALLIDILGFGLIIVAIPIGWIPGPGGIPVLILGLSLLANNHEWAERLLRRVKIEGSNLFGKIFQGSPRTRWAIDILSIVVISIAVILVTQVTRSATRTAALSLIISALFLFFGNRRRYHKLWLKIKLGKHKH